MDEVELLKGAVQIKSISGQEREVIEYFLARMIELGFDAHIDEAGNVVGQIGKSEKPILLVGHIDTVPGDIPIRIEDGKLYGRGSVDAKGPFCAFMVAAAKARMPCIVVGAVEEECATSKGARHLIGKYNPSAIIIGEPSSSGCITLGYKGRLLCDYELKKDCGHSASTLSAGDNALIFHHVIASHLKSINERKSNFESVQMTVRKVDTHSDGMHDNAKMALSFRLPPGFDFDAFESFLDKAKGDAKIELYGKEIAIKSEKNNTLVRAFLSAIRNAGKTPSFKYKTGTSDMNVLGAAYDCPILAYGPGDSSLDHTPEENISIEEYKESIAILTDTLRYLYNPKPI
ncbi:MAG: [LysW]-lysine hydrolase [Nanoarchaeota archaeon]|nr:[LysW]-lysine hydrolase [Nanoarchaeota archaeon]